MQAWSTGHIASLFGVHRKTVRYWMKKRELRCYQLPVSGYYRVNPEVLAEWCHKIGRPDVAQKVLAQMASQQH